MPNFVRPIIILLFCINYTSSMELTALDDQDPPFFKIELEDGNIFYLSGSHHDIPYIPLDLLRKCIIHILPLIQQ